ncbi:MAG TPA: nucleoside 2-deoxyribosyltransferase [Candidatus Pacearchaeota archaeon]|nr:nucleoside 2-deoxyribosyltransferase [Candidatus Pacearchaeota archaeon]
MKSVYLAGPITGLSYNGCTDWRKYAIAELRKWGIAGISPLRAKEYLASETNVADKYDNFVLSTQKGITTRDRFDVNSCDVMLANLLGAQKVSIGTMIEYGWADAARKPIITIMEKEGNIHDHSMLREITGYKAESLEEGLFVAKAMLFDEGAQEDKFLADSFLRLWNRIGAQSDAEQKFNELKSRYSEPHRFYHNFSHLKNCLNELDSVRLLAKNPDLIEFAIWYHDAIYDSKSEENEEKSAKLSRKTCFEAHLPRAFANGARELILATKQDHIPQGIDSKLVMDIDLSILGKEPKQFEEYERNIRKEYSWVSENQFKQRRSEILQKFLNRDSVYLTDFFRKKYESQAQANLQRSLNNLKK